MSVRRSRHLSSASAWLLLVPLMGACTLQDFQPVGRPCDDQKPCGPGTRCDPATHLCVLPPSDLPVGALDRAVTESRPPGDRAPSLDRRTEKPRPLDQRLEPRLPDKAPLRDQPLSPDLQPWSCTTKYGTVPGFHLCQENATNCIFDLITASQTSCAVACQARGGSCLQAADHGPQPCEASVIPIACTKLVATAVCTCSR